MTTYYVGIGGNDGNNGTTWALRKLTLNGAEDIPVAANDTVYVGPGCYRELLTVDVSGAAGQPITYIGDVTGEHTDGVGGIVRITGSDNDLSAVRNYCIRSTTKHYRTFQSLLFDTSLLMEIWSEVGGTNWIVQDCVFGLNLDASIRVEGTSANWTVRRCIFRGNYTYRSILFTHSAVVDNAGHLVENCLFLAGVSGVEVTRVGGITVKNCSFVGRLPRGVYVSTAITVGQTIVVNNCIFEGLSIGALVGTVAGEIVENYNTFYANAADRVNTDIGANSVTYPALLNPFMMLAGLRFPQPLLYSLSNWSAVRAITGTGAATDDLFGMARPATAAKNSWGAVQFADVVREVTTIHAGSVSIKFEDAGRHQIFVPTTAVETTISVYCYREADYAGTNPQMVIKQPGVADRTTTDAGAAAGWNQLTDTFTPAASPPYVIVELVSNNSAVAGSYACYFDDMVVR